MTYCLGWRTPNEAYLVADAAITSGDPVQSPQSSFGERHIEEKSQSVEERALKIVKMGDAAITFAGDTVAAREFCHIVQKWLDTGLDPSEAFRNAANSIIGPPKTPPFRAIMAAKMGDDPLLMSFNADGTGTVKEVETVVHIGSLDPAYFSQVGHILENVERDVDNPDARLACVLGLCQSFTVHNYILEQGVGGTFCGLYVDQRGAHWMSDICYLMRASDAFRSERSGLSTGNNLTAVAAVREDCLVNLSDATGGINMFYSSRYEDERTEEMIERGLKAVKAVRLATIGHQFDFVTCISTSFPLTVVFELQKQAEAKHIGMIDAEGATSGEKQFVFSESVGQMLKGEGLDDPRIPTILFLRYEPKA